ncbi:PadR family transcriptional regulator [Arthrobacter sp. SO3]|uniref:PadR family transcriptional regulator n=1 Tax=Arthrobacter sp. SO3 TaxID=1897057 RepID=UPI001CFF6BC5|nr:helix-turn-helix transcriptional regulator [Arthrobacter sp. SO3]MCB5293156.1 hypothetical protein [Arthrobacter sp. SO3]
MSVSLRKTPAMLDVLHALETKDEVWGLKVVRDSGRPAGSVYPILSRLEAAGFVSSEWEPVPEGEGQGHPGPRRRYYRLTDEGAAFAATSLQAAHGAQRKPRLGFARGVGLA